MHFPVVVEPRVAAQTGAHAGVGVLLCLLPLVAVVRVGGILVCSAQCLKKAVSQPVGLRLLGFRELGTTFANRQGGRDCGWFGWRENGKGNDEGCVIRGIVVRGRWAGGDRLVSASA